jgi:hypothetical protein
MAFLELTNSTLKTVIDDEDMVLVSKYKWCLTGKGYVSATVNKVTTGIHRLVMGLSPGDGLLIDHINMDKLDNRRCNLRVCTRSQNQCNRKVFKNNPLGLRGVKQTGRTRFSARIWWLNRNIELGTFGSSEEAARAYDKAAKELHGEFARLNFPESRESA